MPIRQAGITTAFTPDLATAFARCISPERWRTYQQAAGFDEDRAHRLYLWNAAIGQSFHFPLQTAEVALRNVVHRALVALYGPSWATDPACLNVLGLKQQTDINKASRRHYRIYNAAATTPQVVASLSLGFWVTLLRREYNNPVWSSQSPVAFPHLAANESMVDVSRTGIAVQTLRNRIFHQEPLIGHNLSGEYGAILKLIGWMCPDMREWTRMHSSVSKVIRERPK